MRTGGREKDLFLVGYGDGLAFGGARLAAGIYCRQTSARHRGGVHLSGSLWGRWGMDDAGYRGYVMWYEKGRLIIFVLDGGIYGRKMCENGMTCELGRKVITRYGRRICGERFGNKINGRTRVGKKGFRVRKQSFSFLAFIAASAVGENMSRIGDIPM